MDVISEAQYFHGCPPSSLRGANRAIAKAYDATVYLFIEWVWTES